MWCRWSMTDCSNEAHLHRKLQTMLSKLQVKKNQPWKRLTDQKQRNSLEIKHSLFVRLSKLFEWCHACTSKPAGKLRVQANISHVNTHYNLLQVKARTSNVNINYHLALLVSKVSFKKCCSAFHGKIDPAVWSLVNVFKNWDFKYHCQLFWFVYGSRHHMHAVPKTIMPKAPLLHIASKCK